MRSYIARDKLVELKPDVMTLDVEMPKMDGITFLEKVMVHFPTRTLLLSSLSEKGSETALRALELGAVDVMGKPAMGVQNGLLVLANELILRVKTVAMARLPVVNVQRKVLNPKATIAKVPHLTAMNKTTHCILAIASSTGGTEALKRVLPLLPADIPGTVIVQHMPPVFTKTFAETLNKICPFEVREAVDGDGIYPGRVLLAPGNFHMEVARSGANYYIKLHQEPLLHGVRPAADYLMKSVAQNVGKNAIGLVLTGMGRDGAEGLLQMKKAGSHNIAQDEATCAVFGMPKVAIEMKAVDKVLPLDEIVTALIRQIQFRAVA
jgi:two-component system chemotaxis response regulator CheB